jgi:MFS family permease
MPAGDGGQVAQPEEDDAIEAIHETVALPDDVRPHAANRNFALLWGGQFISQMGDRLAMVAFPWLVYRSTDSAFSTGVTLALYTLPYVVFGLFAGVVIDRFNKRALMICADLARAALVLSVPFLAARWLPSVYVLSFATASVSVFFDPCRLAILPDIVPAKRLLRANSLLATGDSLTEVLGYGTAGFVVFYVSTRLAFAADSITFAVSALALGLMRYRPGPRPAARFSARGVGREALDGIGYLLRNRGLTAITMMLMGSAIGLGASYPLTFLFAVRILGSGTRSFGLMESAIALGYLGGSLLMALFGDRVRKGLAITLGIGVLGAGISVLGAVTSLYPALLAFFVAGAANAAAVIGVNTYFQETVEEEMRGRVWGTRFALTHGAFALSVIGAAALATGIDVPTLFIACGAVVAVPALVGTYVAAVRHA